MFYNIIRVLKFLEMGDTSLSNPSSLTTAMIVVVVLVLVGVLAFGLGGNIVANRGVGVGGWGAIRLGMPEGLVRVQERDSRTEGIASIPSTQVLPRNLGDVAPVGVYDTGHGTMAIGGDYMTTMGFEEKYYHGHDPMRPLRTLK